MTQTCDVRHECDWKCCFDGKNHMIVSVYENAVVVSNHNQTFPPLFYSPVVSLSLSFSPPS